MSKEKIQEVIQTIEFYQSATLNREDRKRMEDAIEMIEEFQKYQELGSLKELNSKIEELKRWHTDVVNEEIKNPFVHTSTQICHNCDHKDEYIVELESEIEELKEKINKMKGKK